MTSYAGASVSSRFVILLECVIESTCKPRGCNLNNSPLSSVGKDIFKYYLYIPGACIHINAYHEYAGFINEVRRKLLVILKGISVITYDVIVKENNILP